MKVLSRTGDCLVIDGNGGKADLGAIAAAAGEDGRTLLPLSTDEEAIPGIGVYALSEQAYAQIVDALRAGTARLEYRAITATPLWRDGVFDEPFRKQAVSTQFELLETRGAWSELQLSTSDGGTDSMRFHLARAGCAVAGDARRGGPAVAGGIRLRGSRLIYADWDLDVSSAEPADWWMLPDVNASQAQHERLKVSSATVRALQRGHPWIVEDAETTDVSAVRPGTLLDVVGPNDKPIATARSEGRGRVVARLWSRGAAPTKKAASVEARVATALARRQPLLDAANTDGVRLIHGEADGLPGLAIDRLGPMLRVLLTGRACETIVDRTVDAVHGQLFETLGDNPPVVRVVHLAEPPSGPLRAVDLMRGDASALSLEEGRSRVWEGTLSFWIDSGLSAPTRPRPGTGLFLDQRENRAEVMRRARGGRWLNLFCHTGAFSVAALAGGASEVVSVDLSAPYLRSLAANVSLNGLDEARHRSVRMDARRFLESKDAGEFDGIVFDPPTAARAGRRFWSVRREGGAMLAACLRHLRPGGSLLACRNDRAGRGTLAPLVTEIAAEAQLVLAGIEPAAPASDFPALRGFPEGDPFEGVWVTRRP